MEQHVSATVDQTSRFEQLLADLKITSGDLTEVPQQLADVTQAGFEASTSTIAVTPNRANNRFVSRIDSRNAAPVIDAPTNPKNPASASVSVNRSVETVAKGRNSE